MRDDCRVASTGHSVHAATKEPRPLSGRSTLPPFGGAWAEGQPPQDCAAWGAQREASKGKRQRESREEEAEGGSLHSPPHAHGMKRARDAAYSSTLCCHLVSARCPLRCHAGGQPIKAANMVAPPAAPAFEWFPRRCCAVWCCRRRALSRGPLSFARAQTDQRRPSAPPPLRPLSPSPPPRWFLRQAHVLRPSAMQ